MSGQPLVKPLDAEKFRKEYLKFLDLEEANNKKNLDANRLFAKTGTPQQPPDQRSVEEKLEDMERLKVEARPLLRQLMDGANAEKVVQNASGLQLYFLAQGMPYFISTLKPRYRYGLPAEVFLAEVDKYIASLDKGTFDSDQVLLREDIIPVRQMLSGLRTIDSRLMTELMSKLDDLIANSVTRADIEAIRSIADPIQRERENDLFMERIKDTPSRDEFDVLASGIVGRDQMGDIRGANDSARDLFSVVDGAVEGLVVSSPFAGVPMADVTIDTGYYTPQQIMSGRITKPMLSVYMDTIVGIDPQFFSSRGTSKTKLRAMRAEALKQWFIDNDASVKSLFGFGFGGGGDEAPPTPIAEPMGGNGIKRKPRMGTGLVKKNYNVLQDKDIDWKSGVNVPNVARYIPFGRFVINKRRLGEGIISIRTPSGACLNDIKSERVSPNILSVVRTILGGGSPTFEDIERMSDDERNYIHRLASRASLTDRLSIPAPDKKKDEQDINQFEIMKGQIMAGNDSNKLHKDFKLLVMKLMEKKLLPKRQATDILFKMATLGY
jgi:hypothetical protein